MALRKIFLAVECADDNERDIVQSLANNCQILVYSMQELS